MGFTTRLVALNLQRGKYSIAAEFDARLGTALMQPLEEKGRLCQIPFCNPNYRDYMAIVTPAELDRVTQLPPILELLAQLPEITGGRMILVHFAEYDNEDWD
jgi:hypothetical protein